MTRRWLAAAAAVAAVAAAGCSSTSASVPAVGSAAAGSDGAGLVGQATCEDPPGDLRAVTGSTPQSLVAGTDLRRVEITADGQALTVAFTATSAIPELLPDDAVGPVRWVVWTLDGERVLHQLRVALDQDGWQVTFEAGDDRFDLDASVERTDETMKVTFPLEALHDLGDQFGWVALTTQGQPAVQDVCPDAASQSLAPEVQLMFPGRP